MKKTKFDLTAVKKNLNLERLFNCYEKEIEYENAEFYSFHNILESSMPKKMSDFDIDLNYWEYLEKMIKKFYLDTNKKIQKKILKDIFDGQILTKLHNNFKKEILFVFGEQSYVLILSKKNKKYYFFSCIKEWNNKKNKLVEGIEYYNLIKIFQKKVNKRTIFELIMKENETAEDLFMERNKDLSYEQREQLWEDTAYISPTGTNYLKLYKQNKL